MPETQIIFAWYSNKMSINKLCTLLVPSRMRPSWCRGSRDVPWLPWRLPLSRAFLLDPKHILVLVRELKAILHLDQQLFYKHASFSWYLLGIKESMDFFFRCKNLTYFGGNLSSSFLIFLKTASPRARKGGLPTSIWKTRIPRAHLALLCENVRDQIRDYQSTEAPYFL